LEIKRNSRVLAHATNCVPPPILFRLGKTLSKVNMIYPKDVKKIYLQADSKETFHNLLFYFSALQVGIAAIFHAYTFLLAIALPLDV
jgi:hypothetical protein